MRTYTVCVFGPSGGDNIWSHYHPRNCNTAWDTYRGTYQVEATDRRAAGREAIRRAKQAALSVWSDGSNFVAATSAREAEAACPDGAPDGGKPWEEIPNDALLSIPASDWVSLNGPGYLGTKGRFL